MANLDVTTSALINAAMTAWNAQPGGSPLTPISGNCSVSATGEATFRVLLGDASGVFARADFIFRTGVNGEYTTPTLTPFSMRAIPRLIAG